MFIIYMLNLVIILSYALGLLGVRDGISKSPGGTLIEKVKTHCYKGWQFGILDSKLQYCHICLQ